MSKPRGPVTLAVLYPHDSFDPSMEGVETITPEGTPVPHNLETCIVAAAAAMGVRLVRK